VIDGGFGCGDRGKDADVRKPNYRRSRDVDGITLVVIDVTAGVACAVVMIAGVPMTVVVEVRVIEVNSP
jgi:hypothetical protein